MCEKHVGQCFVLRALHRLPSHSSVFKFCFPSFIFFSLTVFKMEIISQSVLTWLKILVIVFFLRNVRNAVSILAVLQACNFFISCSVDANLVADWSWTIWFDILFTFSQLLNLNSRCKIRGTKCLQQTIVLYQYKMFNRIPLSVIEFCEVNMFKPWTICVIEIWDSFFFFSRHAQPPLGLWLCTL